MSAPPMWAPLPPPELGLRCVVVLPVRNEARHIEAALSALAAQRDVSGHAMDRSSFEILCLANNCDDDSAALARTVGRAQPDLRLHVVEVTLPPELSNIGHVRRCLMDEACRRLEAAGSGERAILSTDGDSRVAQDWMVQTLSALALGADAVGGRILTDMSNTPSAQALRVRRLDAVHSLLRSRLASLIDPDPVDPWPRHHQHFGASLALTAAAYRRAGGMPQVPFLEDEALVQALQRVDLRVRHSPAVRVTTSSRLDGRAAVGLSWQLRQWAEAPAEHAARKVEAARPFAQALAARRSLRTAWNRGHVQPLRAAVDAAGQQLARQLGISAPVLLHCLADAEHFGAAWEAIDKRRLEATDARSWVSMPQAVRELRDLVRDSLRQASTAAAPQPALVQAAWAEVNTSSRYWA